MNLGKAVDSSQLTGAIYRPALDASVGQGPIPRLLRSEKLIPVGAGSYPTGAAQIAGSDTNALQTVLQQAFETNRQLAEEKRQLAVENAMLETRARKLEEELALQHELLEDASCPAIEMRTDVPVVVATREVEQYVLDHPGTDAYDISEDLRLPFSVVEAILKDLVSKGILRTGG